MGIIRAAINAVTGGLADTWLEVIEPSPMGEHTVFAPGQLVSQNGKSQNKKGSSNIVSNGSIIHVYDKQMMILVDGGKIVDYTAEPGYFKVDNSSSIKESFSRIKYGGVSSQSQHVFYINLKEIKNIKFGTSSPVQYYDMFYEAELFMRLHGSYSIEITDPFKFYQQVVPNENVTQNRALEFEGEFLKQYNEEFVMELGTAFNQYSADGNRISFITSKSKEMAKYLRDALDDEWREERGFEVKAVAMGMPKYSDIQRQEPGDHRQACRDGRFRQLPARRREPAGLYGEEHRRRHQRGRSQRGRRDERVPRHGHGAEYGRQRPRRLHAESAVCAKQSSAGHATAADAAAGSSAGSAAGASRQLDLQLRRCQQRQILLRVRQPQARGSQKALLRQLRRTADRRSKILPRMRHQTIAA